MKGSVTRRGDAWTVAVDIGPDPVTGKRRQKRVACRTRQQADEKLAELLDAAQSGEYVEPSRERLGRWLTEDWFPAVQSGLRPSTRALYRTNITKYVAPRLGGVPLAAVTTAKLAKLYAELSESGRRDGAGLSYPAVLNVHVTLCRALGDAVDWGLLRSNPALKARPRKPKGSQKVFTVWTADQLRRFLDGVRNDRLYAMWRLSATTGMRRSELLGLRWESVDVEAGEATIERTAVVADGRPFYEDATKTQSSRRTLALDSETAAALRRWRAAQTAERLAAGPAWVGSGHVFTVEDGRPLSPSTAARMFTRRASELGLPSITLRDLRDSYATAALKAGVSVRVVAQRLGHADPAVTLRHYAAALPTDDRDAAAVVAAAITGTCPDTPTRYFS